MLTRFINSILLRIIINDDCTVQYNNRTLVTTYNVHNIIHFERFKIYGKSDEYDRV